MKRLFESNPISHTFGKFFLRISVGSMMLFGHGLSKWERLMDDPGKFADPIGLGPEVTLYMAVFGEVICSGLLIIGLFTRISAFYSACVMVVATFVTHSGDGFSVKEKALLYLIAYLMIFLMGPGKWSVDNTITGKKRTYGRL